MNYKWKVIVLALDAGTQKNRLYQQRLRAISPKIAQICQKVKYSKGEL